ncbi:MAG: hypothetical protein HC897_13160 [Thermoanaerobaculia bacterium]|nr:hypothetical protein [Thermoanaerobaculia bacterium]
MLQLRRPHLSEKLDPKSLSELLTESLPPIDQDLVNQLAEGFQRLERDQAELSRIETAVGAVEVFRRTYAEYCQGLARARAGEVRSGESRYHKTMAQVREAKEAEEHIAETLAVLDRREQETESAIATQRGVLAALEQSEAMQAAQALAAREQLAAEHPTMSLATVYKTIQTLRSWARSRRSAWTSSGCATTARAPTRTSTWSA